MFNLVVLDAGNYSQPSARMWLYPTTQQYSFHNPSTQHEEQNPAPHKNRFYIQKANVSVSLMSLVWCLNRASTVAFHSHKTTKQQKINQHKIPLTAQKRRLGPIRAGRVAVEVVGPLPFWLPAPLPHHPQLQHILLSCQTFALCAQSNSLCLQKHK